MNNLLTLLLLWGSCTQTSGTPIVPDTINDKNLTVTIKSESSPLGIKLTWDDLEIPEVTGISIERSRDAQNFEILTTLDAPSNQFEDETAMFGIFFYRLKIHTEQKTFLSQVIEEEIYLGSHFSKFHPKAADNPKKQIHLVLGNAEYDDKVWVGLYSTQAQLLGEFKQVGLDKQLLRIETDSLKTGQYVYVIKQEDLPMSIYRLDIKQ